MYTKVRDGDEMANHKMKRTIRQMKDKLQWQVVETTNTSDVLEIISNPDTRVHHIYLPPADRDLREIEYLHELCHAYLAETVSPVFGGILVSPRILQLPKYEQECITAAVRVASDWYVDDVLYKLCKQESIAEIVEHFNYVNSVSSVDLVGSPELVYFGGFIAAQYAHYVKNSLPVNTLEAFNDVAGSLLRFDHAMPSAEDKLKLLNVLLRDKAITLILLDLHNTPTLDLADPATPF